MEIPHLTPSELHAIEDLAYGMMIYTVTSTQLISATQPHTSPVDDSAMDTLPSNTSTGVVGFPGPSKQQSSVLQQLLVGQIAMRQDMDRITKHQTQISTEYP